MRVGDENSYGVTVKGINGKETNDIHELMDIWKNLSFYR
jgi:hypothetical protein